MSSTLGLASAHLRVSLPSTAEGEKSTEAAPQPPLIIGGQVFATSYEARQAQAKRFSAITQAQKAKEALENQSQTPPSSEGEKTQDKGKEKQSTADEDLLWYKKVVTTRASQAKIISVKLAFTKVDSEDVRFVLTRSNNSVQCLKFSALDQLSLTEWHEISELLKTSANSLKPKAMSLIRKQTDRVHHLMTTLDYNLPLEERLQIQSLLKLCAGRSSSPSTPAEKMTIFRDLAEKGVKPYTANLNLKVPTSQLLPPSTVLLNPRGVYFINGLGSLAFFRANQIPVADLKFLEIIMTILPSTTPEGIAFKADIIAEFNKRSKC